MKKVNLNFNDDLHSQLSSILGKKIEIRNRNNSNDKVTSILRVISQTFIAIDPWPEFGGGKKGRIKDNLPYLFCSHTYVGDPSDYVVWYELHVLNYIDIYVCDDVENIKTKEKKSLLDGSLYSCGPEGETLGPSGLKWL